MLPAFMLGLWYSRGNLRHTPEHVLEDVNDFCSRAFQEAGKSNLTEFIAVDQDNIKLQSKASRILSILERLNVTVLTAEHDYLGQLYEAFFRYTGGNTIGQYFTPRHIARMMVDACQAESTDMVADLACGTGGFFVAYMSRLVDTESLQREEMARVIQENIVGFEVEPRTAALCIANMILRGGGSTKIRQADSLACLPEFPVGEIDVVLMNPPFPHKRTDAPVQVFVERGLEALRSGGRMAIIVPVSLLSKGGEAARWRERILEKHSLVAVCQLPDDLFQPFASVTTSVIFLENSRMTRRERPFSCDCITMGWFCVKTLVSCVHPSQTKFRMLLMPLQTGQKLPVLALLQVFPARMNGQQEHTLLLLLKKMMN